MEKLYRLKWTQRDGLGALVLTPTRELAIQIFQELRKAREGGRGGGGGTRAGAGGVSGREDLRYACAEWELSKRARTWP